MVRDQFLTIGNENRFDSKWLSFQKSFLAVHLLPRDRLYVSEKKFCWETQHSSSASLQRFSTFWFRTLYNFKWDFNKSGQNSERSQMFFILPLAKVWSHASPSSHINVHSLHQFAPRSARNRCLINPFRPTNVDCDIRPLWPNDIHSRAFKDYPILIPLLEMMWVGREGHTIENYLVHFLVFMVKGEPSSWKETLEHKFSQYKNRLRSLRSIWKEGFHIFSLIFTLYMQLCMFTLLLCCQVFTYSALLTPQPKNALFPPLYFFCPHAYHWIETLSSCHSVRNFS